MHFCCGSQQCYRPNFMFISSDLHGYLFLKNAASRTCIEGWHDTKISLEGGSYKVTAPSDTSCAHHISPLLTNYNCPDKIAILEFPANSSAKLYASIRIFYELPDFVTILLFHNIRIPQPRVVLASHWLMIVCNKLSRPGRVAVYYIWAVGELI